MSTTAIPARPRLSEDVKNLELILQRVTTLSTALMTLLNTHSAQFSSEYQLAPWPTYQHQTTIVEKRLSSLLEAIEQHADLLNSAHAYPLASFNGRNPMHQNILLALLRKKLSPEVEDWVAEGVAAGERVQNAGAGAGAGVDGQRNGDGGGDEDGDEGVNGAQGLSAAQYEELWDWAGPAGNAVARQVLQGEGMDEEDGDEDDDEDGDDEDGMDEDDDDEMEDAAARNKGKSAVAAGPPSKPMMPLEQIMRFMSTGIPPA